MDADCIFCKIVAGEVPSKRVFENERILGFRDVAPAAPTHVLLIPKEHIPTLNDLSAEQGALMGELVMAAKEVAAQEGLTEGYRLVTNCLKGGGQEVFHIHLHLLGGRELSWPPG